MEAKKLNLIPILAILALYVLSWQLQSQLLLNFDVSWLSFAAQQMLAGGKYISHFLETNPPLIIYCYFPLIFLQKTFGLSVIIGTRLYIFALAALSLLLCSRLIRSIFSPNNRFSQGLILISLAAIFLVLPVNEFGQREHLSLILTFPYFLLIALRLQSSASIRFSLAILVGLLAGLGFCLKPYFLLPFSLLEIYYLLRNRTWSANLRPEALAVVFTTCVYLGLIFIFHQDYIHQILPLVSQFYYQRYQRSLIRMLGTEESLFAYFCLSFYFLRYKYQIDRDLGKVCLIGTLGFWFVYLGQRMGWYYHALPFLGLGLVLAITVFLQLIQQKKISTKEWLSVGLWLAATFSCLLIKLPYLNLSAYFYPLAYSSFFFILFFLLAATQGKPRFILALALLFLIDGGFYKYFRFSIFYPHLFFWSAVFFILTFYLIVPASTRQEKYRQLVLACLGLVLFALPAYRAAYIFDYACYFKLLYSQLTTTMKQYAGKTVFYLSNASEMAFPSIHYCDQIYVSRFWSFVWLPSMKNPYDVKTYPAYLKDNQEKLAFYMQALLADLSQRKPQYVFVDVRQRGHYYYTPPPDYLRLFSLRQDFRKQWEHYQYVTTLDSRPLYRLAVYQRKD